MHGAVRVSLVSAIAVLAMPGMVFAQGRTAQNGQPTDLTCLVGYPDGSFQGDRALTRYEFAAGLVACLEPLLPNQVRDRYATPAEVNTLLQTQQLLNQDIRRLQERLDALDGRSTGRRTQDDGTIEP